MEAHEKINSRYLAYMREHGVKNPNEMWERDGKNNCNFTAWIRARLAEFERIHPEWFIDHHTWKQNEFDQFLGIRDINGNVVGYYEVVD